MTITAKEARKLWRERLTATDDDIQNGVMAVPEEKVIAALGPYWESALENPQQLIMARAFPPGTPEPIVYIDKRELAAIVHHQIPATEEEYFALQVTELLCNRMRGADRVIAHHNEHSADAFNCLENNVREHLGDDWKEVLKRAGIGFTVKTGSEGSSVQIDFERLYEVAEPLLHENMERIYQFHRRTGNQANIE